MDPWASRHFEMAFISVLDLMVEDFGLVVLVWPKSVIYDFSPPGQTQL